ncbi:MAG: PDZ domain-containing protein [Gemmatimonadota bacterium]
MRMRGTVVAALTAAVAFTLIAAAAPETAQAQAVVRLMSRGLLGILTEPVPANDMNSRERLIVDVVGDSPAEQAGILKGDTLVRINGLAATRQVMSAPFEPGDTVVLRVRRDGRERDVTLVAAERTDRFEFLTARALPDSVRIRVSDIMDAVRAGVDTVAMRNAFEQLHDNLERLRNDSVFVRGFDGDTARFYHLFRGELPRIFMDRAHIDSLRAYIDSARAHIGDYAVHAFGDSTWFRFGDFGELGLFQPGDSVGFMRPTQIFVDGISAGRRAVAGAELSELNPDLAEYFGTTTGVLVLNARAGTPAARAGLRAGDVILSVGGTSVSSIAELRRAIRAAPSDDVELRVLRRGTQIDIRIEEDSAG